MESKAEKQMSEYGEPWRVINDSGMWAVVTAGINPVAIDFDARVADRTIACVNSLAGIPNPEAVRELVESAMRWRKAQLNGGSLDSGDKRLMKAIAALSAPSPGAQQK